jgi:L-asparaginase
MAKINQKIVVLATGGTIAGTASSAADHTGYTAAQIGVDQLMRSVHGLQNALQGYDLLTEQVAQIDSKDMDFATLASLAARCTYWLARSEVAAVVVTHGTDTLEETAYFLHCVLPVHLQAAKPVVLTCAMRPATSSEADGPRNVCDAVRVALDAQARGVLCVCAGDVHSALHVQKVHSHALNAFSSGDAGLVAQVTGEQIHYTPLGIDLFNINRAVTQVNTAQAAINLIVLGGKFPRVEIVLNHVNATGRIVRALLADRSDPHVPLRGIVVAGTGNGTLASGLEAALLEAQSQGIAVLRASRCAWGGVSATAHDVLPGTPLPAAKARIALALQLLQKGA